MSLLIHGPLFWVIHTDPTCPLRESWVAPTTPRRENAQRSLDPVDPSGSRWVWRWGFTRFTRFTMSLEGNLRSSELVMNVPF